MNTKQAQAIIHKMRDGYNKIAEHFAGTRYDNWPELRQFEYLIKSGQRVLDWGCGHGRLVFLLQADQKNIPVNYYGVDQSDKIIKIGRKKFAKEIKAGWVKFYSIAKRQKKFPDNFFDLVFMIASLHHVPGAENRLKILRDIWRSMKSGGKILITVWNLESDWAKVKALKNDWRILGENDFDIPWKNPKGVVQFWRYHHVFSKTEMKKLLEAAGFVVELVDYYNYSSWTDSKGGRNLVAVATKP